ncbi:PfkB family carbohydrate kinase [Streptomyces sp. NPDC006134]|uniref:PfkB family carbohydrate kinase n=1 Tax=Streptomyces sp. NPDC006134 TaxID=3154467 RepID=UPI00340DBF0A
MTGIVVLGSTHMDLAAYVEKAPRHGETVPGRELRATPGGKGAGQAVAAGSLHAARGTEPLTVPAPRVTAVDSTGADGTFAGALAVALGEDRPVREALAWAATAASPSVQRPGASTPRRTETEARYAS